MTTPSYPGGPKRLLVGNGEPRRPSQETYELTPDHDDLAPFDDDFPDDPAEDDGVPWHDPLDGVA